MADFDHLYPLEYPKNGGFKNLNVGAGPYFIQKHWAVLDFLPEFQRKKDGFFHQDLAKNPDRLPLANLENIYTSHTIEHFDVSTAKRIIAACYKALDQGGTLRVLVPDADLILNAVRENNYGYFWVLNSVFKGQSSELSIEDWAFFLLKTNLARKVNGFVSNDGYDPEIYTQFKSNLNSMSNTQICEWLNQLPAKQTSRGSNHLGAYTGDLMAELLANAGFSDVYRSYFMGSKSPKMRQVPLFDGTHPWLSLYFEASK